MQTSSKRFDNQSFKYCLTGNLPYQCPFLFLNNLNNKCPRLNQSTGKDIAVHIIEAYTSQ